MDCLWVTPSGLNLTVERGRGVVQTAPWQDVFPLSIMGDTPRLPLCRGFLCARQPADARVVHFHKIGAVCATARACALAVRCAQAWQCMLRCMLLASRSTCLVRPVANIMGR